MNHHWQVGWVGMPMGLALLLGAIVTALSLSVLLRETHGLPPRWRRRLVLLRLGTFLAIVALLLGPVVTRESTATEPPRITVLVDASGSMGISDDQMPATERLDEAVALGLIDPSLRPRPWEEAKARAEALAAQLEHLGRLHTLAAGDPAAPAVHLAQAALPAWTQSAQALAGDAAAAAALAPVLQTLRLTAQATDEAVLAPTVADALGGLPERVAALARVLQAGQAAADQALVAGSAAGTPLTQAITRVAAESRLQRVVGIARRALFAAQRQHIPVRWQTLAEGLPPWEEHTSAGGTTDFAGPLAAWARSRSRTVSPGSEAVLLLSDGRRTAGADPRPAARALQALGIPVSCIAIGDPEPPRDAVVAEVRGPQEVVRGELVALDCRLRITGYGTSSWDLVLERDGVEVARRAVRATGQWQHERFEQSDAVVGLHTWRARLERPRATAVLRPGTGLAREVWTGVAGEAMPSAEATWSTPPTETGSVEQASSADPRENYCERWRGWVIAPVTGAYVLCATADDSAEVRLSPSDDPQDAAVVATVPAACPPGVWDRYEAQRSRPLPLQAGHAYYLEVRHKQGLGAAHVAIGWQRPDGVLERPLPGIRLARWPTPGTGVPWPDPAPEASVANNAASCTVAVVDDPLHVLLVDDQPRWDTRLLATLFARDPRAVVDVRYRSARARARSVTLVPAAQDQIDAQDVIVLGDVAPGELDAADQARLVSFVKERGGFLILLSGARAMPFGYGMGGLAALVPVTVGGHPAAAPAAVMVPPGLVEEDAVGSIVAILADRDLNRRLWSSLDPLQWYLPGAAVHPGATVLLTAQDAEHSPIAVAGAAGAGRVLWLATDETWRWRDRLGERLHQAFWLQAVRWGVGGRLHGHDRRLQVAVDRQLVPPGGSIDLLARARTAAGEISTATISARLSPLAAAASGSTAAERRIDLRPVADAAGLQRARLDDLPAGRWRIAVTSLDSDLADVEEDRDVVVEAATDTEGVELSADPGELQRIAEAGGGACSDAAGAADLVAHLVEQLQPAQLTTRRSWRIWGGYGCMAVVLLLVGLEWSLRKRLGLP